MQGRLGKVLIFDLGLADPGISRILFIRKKRKVDIGEGGPRAESVVVALVC